MDLKDCRPANPTSSKIESNRKDLSPRTTEIEEIPNLVTNVDSILFSSRSSVRGGLLPLYEQLAHKRIHPSPQLRVFEPQTLAAAPHHCHDKPLLFVPYQPVKKLRQRMATLFCPSLQRGNHHGAPPLAGLEQRKVMSSLARTAASRALIPPLVSSPHLHDPVGRDHVKFHPP
jgi:hypothetical protein